MKDDNQLISSRALSVDAHCAMLAAHMTARMNDMHDAFRQYMQVLSALAGGSVIATLQYGRSAIAPYSIYLDLLAIFAAMVATILIVENIRAWVGYRNRLHEVAGKDERGTDIIPRARKRAQSMSYAFLFTVWVSSLGLVVANPLR